MSRRRWKPAAAGGRSSRNTCPRTSRSLPAGSARDPTCDRRVESPSGRQPVRATRPAVRTITRRSPRAARFRFDTSGERAEVHYSGVVTEVARCDVASKSWTMPAGAAGENRDEHLGFRPWRAASWSWADDVQTRVKTPTGWRPISLTPQGLVKNDWKNARRQGAKVPVGVQPFVILRSTRTTPSFDFDQP